MTRDTHRKACAGSCKAARILVFGLALLAGCSSFLPKPPAQPTLFVLDDAAPAAALARPGALAPTLIVNATRAAAGFDTQHIVYVRRPHQLEYFALSQWANTPAQMLAPMIARAIERTGAFQAVLPAPSAVVGDFHLDTELIRLQQEFSDSPSRVRLTLRAVLTGTGTRGVVAWREFDLSIPADSDNPYGGVVAANLAAQQILNELAAFCAGAATQGSSVR